MIGRRSGHFSYDLLQDLRLQFPDEPDDILEILHETREQNDRLEDRVKDLEDSLIKAVRECRKLQFVLDSAKSDRPLLGCVYILKSPNGYKIGKTKTLYTRIRQLQTGSSYKIEHVLSIITDNMNELEVKLHRRFSEKRFEGEWFKLSLSDIEAIRQEYENYIVEPE